MKTNRTYCLALFGLLIPWLTQGQERPTPEPVPSYTPAPPPILAEIPPFPSNTDNEIALVAHLYDPETNRFIISVNSVSNDQFVLQRSDDLITWSEEEESKQGNKSIITFFVTLENQSGTAFFRVVKR